VLPVIALAERLGAGEPGPWQRSNRILKVSANAQAYGVAVDGIGRIQRLEEAAAEPPVLADQAEGRFLGALWRIDDGLVQEIRLDALLAADALACLYHKPPRLVP